MYIIDLFCQVCFRITRDFQRRQSLCEVTHSRIVLTDVVGQDGGDADRRHTATDPQLKASLLAAIESKGDDLGRPIR